MAADEMLTGLDHVVILTGDLAEAIRRYADLGFAVERGGSHPAWGTENALIPLADGAYLELLAARTPALARDHPLWKGPDGRPRTPGSYGGYALSSTDLAGDVARIRARTLEVTDPQDGSRLRPDGQLVKWRLAFPARPDLPFLIQDVTPRDLRIAPPAHGLGTDVELGEVTVAVPALDEAADAYARLLDQPGERQGTAPRDASVLFATPRGRIRLVPLDGRAAPGLMAVVLAVRRWTHHTQPVRGALRQAGSLVQLDPARTGGVALYLG